MIGLDGISVDSCDGGGEKIKAVCAIVGCIVVLEIISDGL